MDGIRKGGILLSVFSKISKWLIAALLILAVVCFALPFSHLTAADGASASATGFALLSELDYVAADGTAYDLSAFPTADGGERPSYVHFYALTLLTIALGLCAALFDKDGKKKYTTAMLLSLTGAALSSYLMNLLKAPVLVGSELIAGGIGMGLKLNFVLLAAAFAVSSLGLLAHKKYAPAPAKKPGRGIAWVARVAVLGAVSAVLYYFEVPVIPPIYKLDLSAVPALIAGFAMGPGASLGVMAVKDLIGLTHSSSMGVGELADFLMSGSMTVVASMIYTKKHTLKGAILGLSLGTIAMGLVGALANYFIMIPFYVQVMNMPMEVILSLIAKTVPAVDSLWKMILMAVVPFNLLKGVVLSVVTMLLYKRIAPLLKNL